MSLIWSFLGEFCTSLFYSPYQAFQFLLKNFCSKVGFCFLLSTSWDYRLLMAQGFIYLKNYFQREGLLLSDSLGKFTFWLCFPHLLWELGSFSICWHSLHENEYSIEVHDGIIKCPSKKQELEVFALFANAPMLYNQVLLMCVYWVVTTGSNTF